MVAEAYKLCRKYPQLHILTNINIKNFPDYTKIIPLNTAQDILNAPKNTLVLIDEIGTIFNSRDFSGGKCAVPKPLFQHLCQCRKRRMMIYATVQRFNLLDKQIRDITADVTACHTHFKHPFCRIQTGYTYDIEEYELYSENKAYTPAQMYNRTYLQTNKRRQLYDTSQLVTNMLQKEYLSDEEILANREGIDSNTQPLDRKQRNLFASGKMLGNETTRSGCREAHCELLLSLLLIISRLLLTVFCCICLNNSVCFSSSRLIALLLPAVSNMAHINSITMTIFTISITTPIDVIASNAVNISSILSPLVRMCFYYNVAVLC